MSKSTEWRPKKRSSSERIAQSKKKENKKPANASKKASSSQSKNKSTGKKKTKLTKKKLWTRRILITCVILSVVGIITLVGIFAYFSKDLPSPDKINQRNIAESSKIYDRDKKEVLYEMHGEQKRTIVDLEDISKHIQNATLAAEDQQFYNHIGFNPKGILTSFFKNSSTGSKAGGSTITQQFVKNSILTPEKTYSRKIKELILSLEIEAKFDKDEILNMYLNEIPYGSNAYGAEAAAQTFYEKAAKEMTIAESAYLAALPNAPTYYSPYGTHVDALEGRKDWILAQMLDNDFITQKEHDTAVEEKVEFKEPDEGIIAAHFVLYVREILEEKYSEELIKEGGFEIITTLDLDLQYLAERVVSEGVDSNAKYNATNAALAAVDPRNGQVLAMQGSKDYFDRENDGNVNVARSLRQPGSSFKPFAYAKAFEEGYTPETILFDVYTDFGNNYKPQNYDLSTKGPVTMRDALQGSLNIPAVKTLYLAGVEDTIQFAERLGITSLGDRSRFGLSLVLGGGEVQLLEETGAYGVFANNGVKHAQTPILKIIDRNGKELENNENPEGEEAMTAKAAKLINNVLSDNNARRKMLGGLANNLTVSGVDVAAKTGTTQNFKDAWTVGYTTDLAVGVWVGNNDGSEMKSGAAGIYAASPLWKKFMTEAVKGRDSKPFDGPEPDSINKPILRGQVMPEQKVKVHKVSGKIATDLTPLDLVEERTYRVVHNILHYLNKDNPRGPGPSNPKADKQYNSWEGAVQGWAAKQEYVLEEPPTELDDSNASDKQPTVSFTSPSDGAVIKDSAFKAAATGEASQGIKKIEFIIDSTVLATDTSFPYEAAIDVTTVTNGFHNLTAKITDLVGNVASSTVAINVNIDRVDPTTISLSTPSSDKTLAGSDFPIKITSKVAGSTDISKLEFFVNGTVVGRKDGSSNNKAYTFNWTNPGPGSYTIQTAAVDVNGTGVFSKKVTITVE